MTCARRCCRKPAIRRAGWLDQASPPTFPLPPARKCRRARSPTACARRSAAGRSTSSCSRQRDRRKRLFLADMDSTMIGQECIDELADYRRPEGACRRDHRARHARRDRLRAGAARARRAAEGPAGRRWSTRCISERITLTPGGARRWSRTMRANGALHLPRLRRLHAVHQPRSPR